MPCPSASSSHGCTCWVHRWKLLEKAGAFFSCNIAMEASSDPDDGEDLQLPKHTVVVVRGNARTKPALVGLQGVVRKAVGLGGWHWLLLSSGEEVRLQRNALTVLAPPTGQESVRCRTLWGAPASCGTSCNP